MCIDIQNGSLCHLPFGAILHRPFDFCPQLQVGSLHGSWLNVGYQYILNQLHQNVRVQVAMANLWNKIQQWRTSSSAQPSVLFSSSSVCHEYPCKLRRQDLALLRKVTSACNLAWHQHSGAVRVETFLGHLQDISYILRLYTIIMILLSIIYDLQV